MKDSSLLHKHPSYWISAKLFSILKYFLSGKSMKDFINGQSSVDYDNNAEVCQDTLVRSTIYLLYINDPSKNILRSLVNMYADDTRV